MSVVVVLLIVFAAGAVYLPSPASAARDAKVVLVVGPTGDFTPGFRALAEDAADAAAAMGSRVVKIYSPYATWPAVRSALNGASVVVYLGHGNGWPSRYRSSPWPYSQNGLGLNPEAGRNDTEHQYFGEFYLARDVNLAPGAIVIMSRLCYASGNTEPGLPEGTVDMARQRVDNYAAGWIRAGARAVIADAFTAPAYYVRSLLAGTQRVESVWRGSPNNRANNMEFRSARSPGHIVRMNPDRATSGFYRSLVMRASAADLRGVPAGRGGSYASTTLGVAASSRGGSGEGGPPAAPAPIPEPTRAPTLAEAGFRFGTPKLSKSPIAGRPTSLAVPVRVPTGLTLPSGMTGAVRWDPLELAVQPAAPTPLFPPEAGDPGKAPADEPSPGGSAPAAPIVPEVLGDVVLTELVKPVEGGVTVSLAVPPVPGLYRLSVLIANRDGQALSEGKEPLIPAQLVRVASPLQATYRVKQDVIAPASSEVALPVTVVNSGSVEWAAQPGASSTNPEPGWRATTGTARLTAHWVGLGQSDEPVTPASVSVGALRPGQSVAVTVRLATPATPGDYALLLDVVAPIDGSLTAAGADPGLVRVTVRDTALNSGSPTREGQKTVP